MKHTYVLSAGGERLEKALIRLRGNAGITRVKASKRTGLVSVRFDGETWDDGDIIQEFAAENIQAAAAEKSGSAAAARMLAALALSGTSVMLSLFRPLRGLFSYPLTRGIAQLILMGGVWFLCSRLISARRRTTALLAAFCAAAFSVVSLIYGAKAVSCGESPRMYLLFDCAALVPALSALLTLYEKRLSFRSEAALTRAKLTRDGISASRTRAAKRVKRLTGAFSVLCPALAALTALIWLKKGEDSAVAVRYAVCVLLAACPGAPLISVPAAVTRALVRTANNGCPVSNAPALENLGRADTFLLDSEDTLTRGEAAVCGYVLSSGSSYRQLLALAAGALQNTDDNHARAILKAAKDEGIPLDPLLDREDEGGTNTRALIGDTRVLTGSFEFMRKNAADLSGWEDKTDALIAEGCYGVFVAALGKIQGILALRDELLPCAADAVKALKQNGARVCLLSRDGSGAAKALAVRAGADEVIAPESSEMSLRLLKADKKRLCGIYTGSLRPEKFDSFTCVSLAEAPDADAHAAVETLSGLILTARETVKSIRKARLLWLLYELCALPIASGALYRAAGISLSPLIFAPVTIAVYALFMLTGVRNRVSKAAKRRKTRPAIKSKK